MVASGAHGVRERRRTATDWQEVAEHQGSPADPDRRSAGDRYQVVLHVEPAALRADTGGPAAGASVATLPHYDAAGGDTTTESSDAADVSAETPPTDIEDVSAEMRPGAGTTPVPLRQTPRMAGHAALEDADGLRVSAETARRDRRVVETADRIRRRR